MLIVYDYGVPRSPKGPFSSFRARAALVLRQFSECIVSGFGERLGVAEHVPPHHLRWEMLRYQCSAFLHALRQRPAVGSQGGGTRSTSLAGPALALSVECSEFIV